MMGGASIDTAAAAVFSLLLPSHLSKTQTSGQRGGWEQECVVPPARGRRWRPPGPAFFLMEEKKV